MRLTSFAHCPDLEGIGLGGSTVGLLRIGRGGDSIGTPGGGL
jgi:hypothetical protein